MSGLFYHEVGGRPKIASPSGIEFAEDFGETRPSVPSGRVPDFGRERGFRPSAVKMSQAGIGTVVQPTDRRHPSKFPDHGSGGPKIRGPEGGEFGRRYFSFGRASIEDPGRGRIDEFRVTPFSRPLDKDVETQEQVAMPGHKVDGPQ